MHFHGGGVGHQGSRCYDKKLALDLHPTARRPMRRNARQDANPEPRPGEGGPTPEELEDVEGEDEDDEVDLRGEEGINLDSEIVGSGEGGGVDEGEGQGEEEGKEEGEEEDGVEGVRDSEDEGDGEDEEDDEGGSGDDIVDDDEGLISRENYAVL